MLMWEINSDVKYHKINFYVEGGNGNECNDNWVSGGKQQG